MLPLWQYNDGGIWKRTFDLDEVNVRYTFEVDPDGQITMEEQISSLIFDHPKNTFHEETCSDLTAMRAGSSPVGGSPRLAQVVLKTFGG